MKPSAGILLVEDDSSLMFVLSEWLSGEGYPIFTAANSAEALAQYREHAKDVCVALIDVMLPGTDGLTTAVEMRKIDDDIAFLFMSGYEVAEIKKIGINIEDIPRSEFFRKPFSFENLRNRIRSLCAR
ncbi:MAG TPA: response regulator [Syntrophorhabdales bacterium]|nr:response regulator [Syntrophorhabdales bacterium]